MKAYIRLIVLLAGAMLSSCMADIREDADPAAPSQSVVFSVSVPAAMPAASRALAPADEYAVADIAVLAFDAGVLVARYPGTIISGPTSTGGASATLNFTAVIPPGTYDLMVTANAAAMTAALTPAMSRAAVEEALTMTMTSAGWNTATLPMWGSRDAVSIHTPVAVGPIELTRMVAKVDVLLGPDAIVANNFTLNSVRVYNYVTQGRLVPGTPAVPFAKANPASEWIERAAADPWQSITNDIYLFEAPAGTATAADNTCLVIGGSYMGGAATYYRVDFAQETSPDTFTYIPIVRNTAYTMTIAAIHGDGRATPEDALAGPPLNITASVLDWTDPRFTILVTDSDNVLGLSQGSFVLDGTARTTPTADNTLLITTDVPGGWTVEGIVDATTGANVTWLRTTSNGTTTLTSGAANDITTVVLALDANTTAERSAIIRIVAGRLQYDVKVTQTVPFTLTTDAADYYELDGQTYTIAVTANSAWEITAVSDPDDILQNEQILVGTTSVNAPAATDNLDFTTVVLNLAEMGKKATITFSRLLDGETIDVTITADGVLDVGPFYIQGRNESASIAWALSSALSIVTGATSTTDGKGNTLKINLISATDYPPANKCFQKNQNWESITDVSDPNFIWYLPAIDQLLAVYPVNSSFDPAYQLSANYHWSSTENDAGHSWIVTFNGGSKTSFTKVGNEIVRCIRDKE